MEGKLDIKDLCYPSRHQLSLNCDDILGVATWPTLSPQGSAALVAELQLLLHCQATNTIDSAFKSWKCILSSFQVELLSKCGGTRHIGSAWATSATRNC